MQRSKGRGSDAGLSPLKPVKHLLQVLTFWFLLPRDTEESEHLLYSCPTADMTDRDLGGAGRSRCLPRP